MACKHGIRQDIESAKQYYKKQKEYDPFRKLWDSLVQRDGTEGGYEGFNEAERIYFAVGVFHGEVYNGGMDQFFWNRSGDMFRDVVNGLLELRAHEALKLLLRAKEILFAGREPPQDRGERWRAMRQYAEEDSAPRPDWDVELEQVDNAYFEDPDRLEDKLRAFAEERGLVAPFII